MANYSKHNQIKSRKVLREKRTRQIAGSGEDDGKWYKCWNCGFINNIDRNSVGPGEGLTYSIGIIDNDIVSSGNDGYIVGQTGSTVLLSSTTITGRHNIGSEANSGCSFCGSRNYR